MVEETRIRMGLLYPNWLPIAITFNHKSSSMMRDSDYEWKTTSMIIAYAVCCRMLAAVYSIPITTAQARMDAAVEEYRNFNKMCNSEMYMRSGDDLIVGTLQHIAGRVKKVKPAVDSLVLFIDESAALVEHSKYPSTEFRDDAYAELRQVLLGREVGMIFNTSLVMTSLSVYSYGPTESSRIIRPIELAPTLPVDHIVDNIWIPSFQHRAASSAAAAAAAASLIGIDARERSMLKCLAASVSAAPRLVEFMGAALQAEFVDTWPSSSSSSSSSWSSSTQQGLSLTQSMAAVLSAFDRMLRQSSYADARFPVGKYLHALINEKLVDMDDTALQLIRSSSFTNSVTDFPACRGFYQQLVPESILCLLATSASSSAVVNADGDAAIARAIQDEFKAIWANLLNHLTTCPPLLPPLLVDLLARVLRTRILSMHLREHRPGSTTLQALLAIENISHEGIKYTTGEGPYSAAKISSTGKTVVQAGVKRNLLKKWEAATFEHAGIESYGKEDFLQDLLTREIIVPGGFLDMEPLPSSSSSSNSSSGVDLTAWKESIRAIDTDSNLVLKEPRPNTTNDDHCNNLMLFGKMALTSRFSRSSSSSSSSSSNTASTSSSSDDREKIIVVFEEGENNGDSNQIWRGHFIQQGKAGKEKGPYDRYEKFCQAVASITESDLEGDRGYLRALKEGRFIYVYVTTHAGPMVYLAPQDLPHIQTNSLGVLVLNRDVTKRIMRATYDVYALTRSAL